MLVLPSINLLCWWTHWITNKNCRSFRWSMKNYCYMYTWVFKIRIAVLNFPPYVPLQCFLHPNQLLRYLSFSWKSSLFMNCNEYNKYDVLKIVPKYSTKWWLSVIPIKNHLKFNNPHYNFIVWKKTFRKLSFYHMFVNRDELGQNSLRDVIDSSNVVHRSKKSKYFPSAA